MVPYIQDCIYYEIPSPRHRCSQVGAKGLPPGFLSAELPTILNPAGLSGGLRIVMQAPAFRDTKLSQN